MEPFLNSGGAFRPQIVKVGATLCPHKGNISKIQFIFNIHTNWDLFFTCGYAK